MCLKSAARSAKAAAVDSPAPGEYHGNSDLHGFVGLKGLSGPAHTLAGRGTAAAGGNGGPQGSYTTSSSCSSNRTPGPGAYQDLKSFPEPLGRVVGKASVLKHSRQSVSSEAMVSAGLALDKKGKKGEGLTSCSGLGTTVGGLRAEGSLGRTAERSGSSSIGGGTGRRRVSWADNTQFRDSLEDFKR
jgi:hypothetical protein